jgi:hypothetical protein
MWSPPVIAWNGAESAALPMDTISVGGRVVFFVVELSTDGNKRSFIVDSGSSSTLFTAEFARTLKAEVSLGSRAQSWGQVGQERRRRSWSIRWTSGLPA